MAALPIDLDRAARTPLATQIYRAARDAIETGRLDPGAKLPSWRDMAAKLGVSRGTVSAQADSGRLLIPAACLFRTLVRGDETVFLDDENVLKQSFGYPRPQQ